MKLSIVVPVYNTAEYLCECIDSLLFQTRQADEILLIDDGSTDNSGLICDQYAEQYPNVLTFHKKNEGLGYTRNYGIKHATGDYILFVDSDDYLSNDYLSTMESEIIKTACDTCKTSFRRFDNKGNTNITNPVNRTLFKGKEVKTDFLPRLIGSSPEKSDVIPMSSCCTMYSMKIINDNQIEFVSERKLMSEDMIFNLRYYSYANVVLLSDYVGYNYRVNDNSLSTNYLEGRFKKSIQLVESEIDLLNEIGIYDQCDERLSKQLFIYTKMSIEQLRKTDFSNTEKNKEIETICDNAFLQNRIARYPRNKLSIKQRVFIELIRHKCITLLRLLLA